MAAVDADSQYDQTQSRTLWPLQEWRGRRSQKPNGSPGTLHPQGWSGYLLPHSWDECAFINRQGRFGWMYPPSGARHHRSARSRPTWRTNYSSIAFQWRRAGKSGHDTSWPLPHSLRTLAWPRRRRQPPWRQAQDEHENSLAPSGPVLGMLIKSPRGIHPASGNWRSAD